MSNFNPNAGIEYAKKQWRLYQNYAIIAILSLLTVFFMPMLGSSVGLGLNLPNTFAGWIIYLTTKICVVIINILIFDQFVKQGKVNVKDDPKYIEAENILLLEEHKEEPILPANVLLKKMYRSKMTTTAIFTVFGVFGFTNALLTFDWVSMISYIFTITMGLIFGWIAMNKAEEIWTDKHYKYAKKIEKERELEAKKAEEELEAEVQRRLEMAKKELLEQVNDPSILSRGIDVLEPNDCNSESSNTSQPVVVDSSSSSTSDLGNTSSSDVDSSDLHPGVQEVI